MMCNHVLHVCLKRLSPLLFRRHLYLLNETPELGENTGILLQKHLIGRHHLACC